MKDTLKGRWLSSGSFVAAITAANVAYSAQPLTPVVEGLAISPRDVRALAVFDPALISESPAWAMPEIIDTAPPVVLAEAEGSAAAASPPVGEIPEGAAAAKTVDDTPPAAIGPAALESAELHLPAPRIDSDGGEQAQAESAASQPEPETITTTPEAVLPAPALSSDQGGIVSPDNSTEASGAPVAAKPPSLGVTSPPLSLAQVLLPGEAPVPGQIAPSFDLVRVAPDGSAVIAGRAAPGAHVQVLSGALPVAEATASPRGEFVVFLDSPAAPSLDPNIPAIPEGAQLVVSEDDIVILPAQPNTPEASPMVLHRTPGAVQIVQPSGLAVPGNVSLDLVSYAESGAVHLAGRGQPGNTARIYANDSLVGETAIAAGGDWVLEIAELLEGRYILRVDEISPTGDVLSRTESPFQREFPEANLPETFAQGATVIVQPGNTLWLMATEAYGEGGDYTQIFSANREAIRDPDLIYPGQIFSIPREEE